MLQDDNSIFTSLVNNTGAHAAARLRRLARRTHLQPDELEAHSSPTTDSSSPAPTQPAASTADIIIDHPLAVQPGSVARHSAVMQRDGRDVGANDDDDGDLDLGASIYGSQVQRTARTSLGSVPRPSVDARRSMELRMSQRRFSEMLDTDDGAGQPLAPGPADASGHVVEHHHSVEAADVGEELQAGNRGAGAPVPDLEMRQMER